MGDQRAQRLFRNIFCSAAICCGLLAGTVIATDITTAGARLVNMLNQTRVEELWPAGVHVSWETGEPDGRPEKTGGKHTHCSVFVAATARKLGVYILRPPEHGELLLANAQYDWLSNQGQLYGWQEVQGGEQAQEFASRGYLVVATYRNHHDSNPGHIAIVRPSSKSVREIQANGPQITQAGGTNYISTTLKQGFADHPGAWANNEVRYFAHVIDWTTLP
jgi:hypothetical protein